MKVYIEIILLLLVINDQLSLGHCKTVRESQKYCSCGWIKDVFDYIKTVLQPPHITIFLADSRNEEFYYAKRMLKLIVGNTSSLVITTSGAKASDPIFQLPVFFTPRVTNCYIVLYPTKNLYKNWSEIDAREVEDIIDLLADIALRPVRPRLLLIFVGTKTVSDEVIESLSLHAWSRKFIEFTTLRYFPNVRLSNLDPFLTSGDRITYHYYNPFFDQHHSGIYNVSVDLFPDKTRNFHGYILKIAATNNPPYINLERNETGDPILNHTGSSHRIIRILAKKLNFKFTLPPSSFEFFSEGHNDSLFNRLLQGEINLSMNHVFVRKACTHFTKLERSIITITEEYSALVPVHLDQRVKTPQDFIYYVLICMSMFLLFYILIYLLKFDKRYWSGTKVFQNLLNITIQNPPMRWPERCVFFSITFFAFNVSVNFVTELTKIQFEQREDLASNNLELMAKSGFTPVVLEQFLDLADEEELESNPEFKARKQVLRSPEDCAIRIDRGEKLVCFMTKFIGESLIQNYRNANKAPKVKLIDPPLWSSWKNIVFERGSPFKQAFDRVLRQLRDAGLLARFVYDVTVRKEVYIPPTREEILGIRIITLHQLLVELIFGYSLAIVSFVLEILVYKIKENVNLSRGKLRIKPDRMFD